MDEVWERAVETALDGQTDCASVRTLTLDGVVKCVHGRLPPPGLLEKFQSLEHLSVANIGASSLESFPRLPNLLKLILSDNRIAGGLEFLVVAGLDSLRDLDLSNNRIQYIDDLAPLAQLKLVSLDLYECPVTRTKDYRSRVFGLIGSLKYLDKMDADENERPESDEEEDEDEDEEDDPGSGEIDGGYRLGKTSNGGSAGSDGVLDVDEDEESDADEEETEIARTANGSNRSSHQSNGFRVEASMDGEEDDEDAEDDLGEEIDEEEGEDEDVVEVHEIEDSDDEEDRVEDEDEVEEEEVEDEDEDVDPGSTGRVTSNEGEIDGHEQGEEDENGEIGEDEEQGVEEDGDYEEDEDEDYGTEYLVQPIGQVDEDAGGSDFDPGNEDVETEEEVEDEEEVENGELLQQPSTSSHPKRKRDEETDDTDDDDDGVVDAKSRKHL